MQRIIGVALGAVATFIVLWIYDATKFTDAIPAYGIAAIVGAVVSLLWPWVIGLWAIRRARDRREDRIEREVERQLADKS